MATYTLAGGAVSCNLSDNSLVVGNKPRNNEVAFKTKKKYYVISWKGGVSKWLRKFNFTW